MLRGLMKRIRIYSDSRGLGISTSFGPLRIGFLSGGRFFIGARLMKGLYFFKNIPFRKRNKRR